MASMCGTLENPPRGQTATSATPRGRGMLPPGGIGCHRVPTFLPANRSRI